MTDKQYHCKFCSLPIDINRTYDDSISDTYECLECEVNYSFNNDDSIYFLSYDIDDDKYLFVMMDLPENKTYIYLTVNASNILTVKNPIITIAGVYPETRPEDITAFANRICNLKVFL